MFVLIFKKFDSTLTTCPAYREEGEILHDPAHYIARQEDGAPDEEIPASDEILAAKKVSWWSLIWREYPHWPASGRLMRISPLIFYPIREWMGEETSSPFAPVCSSPGVYCCT
jgi:hypothetical protein